MEVSLAHDWQREWGGMGDYTLRPGAASVTKSASIQRYVTPHRPYRFRSLKKIDQELDAIKSAYIWSADYTEMNDPMEGHFRSSALLQKSRQYEAVVNAIADKKLNIGISAFSEVNDHELMWAHYTDKFRGICVEYDFSRLLRNLAPTVEFVRLYYNEELPTVGRGKRSVDTLAKMVLSYKNHRWLYEREWRMFGVKGPNEYSDQKCVSCVYLGNRIDDEHRARTEETLGEIGIKIRYMKIDGYKVRFDKMPQTTRR